MDRFVGSSDLKRGLLKLGIGVSSKVADTLIKELGGTTHFTAHDLASFTQLVGDCKVNVRSSARRTTASAGGGSAAGAPFSSQGELSVDEQTDESIVSPNDSKVEGGALEQHISTPHQDGREQGVTLSGGLGRTDDDTTSPLVLGTRPCSQDQPTEFLWDDLPCWAREASKRALRELMVHHQR